MILTKEKTKSAKGKVWNCIYNKVFNQVNNSVKFQARIEVDEGIIENNLSLYELRDIIEDKVENCIK